MGSRTPTSGWEPRTREGAPCQAERGRCPPAQALPAAAPVGTGAPARDGFPPGSLRLPRLPHLLQVGQIQCRRLPGGPQHPHPLHRHVPLHLQRWQPPALPGAGSTPPRCRGNPAPTLLLAQAGTSGEPCAGWCGWGGGLPCVTSRAVLSLGSRCWRGPRNGAPVPQVPVQTVLVVLALASVPVLLLGTPLYLCCQQRAPRTGRPAVRLGSRWGGAWPGERGGVSPSVSSPCSR